LEKLRGGGADLGLHVAGQTVALTQRLTSLLACCALPEPETQPAPPPARPAQAAAEVAVVVK
jgi:hypothetical protein